MNVIADSGNVTDILANVTDGRCCVGTMTPTLLLGGDQSISHVPRLNGFKWPRKQGVFTQPWQTHQQEKGGLRPL